MSQESKSIVAAKKLLVGNAIPPIKLIIQLELLLEAIFLFLGIIEHYYKESEEYRKDLRKAAKLLKENNINYQF